jgi:hypothetical protein
MRIESEVSYSLLRALSAIMQAIGKDIEEPRHASWHVSVSSIEVDQRQLETEIRKWGQGVEPVEVVCDIDVYFDDYYNQDEENLSTNTTIMLARSSASRWPSSPTRRDSRPPLLASWSKGRSRRGARGKTPTRSTKFCRIRNGISRRQSNELGDKARAYRKTGTKCRGERHDAARRD